MFCLFKGTVPHRAETLNIDLEIDPTPLLRPPKKPLPVST